MKNLTAGAFLVMSFFFGGCSAIQQNEAAQKEKWLRKAGFLEQRADAAQRRAVSSQVTPWKIERTLQGREVIYSYVNPVTGRLFVGGPRQYEAYKRIEVSTKARRSANLAQIRRRNTGPLLW